MSTAFSAHPQQPTTDHSPLLDRDGARKPTDKSSPNSEIKKQTAAMSLANLFNGGGGVLTQDSVETTASADSSASLSRPMPTNNLNGEMQASGNPRVKEKENFHTSKSKRKSLEPISEHYHRGPPPPPPSYYHAPHRGSYTHCGPREDIYYPNYHPSYPITFSSPRKKSKQDYSTMNTPENNYKQAQAEEVASMGGSFPPHPTSSNSEMADTTPQRVAAILASELPFSGSVSNQPVCGDPDAVEFPPAPQMHGFSSSSNCGMRQLMEATRFASPVPQLPPMQFGSGGGRRRPAIHPDEIASINLTEKEMLTSLMTRKEKSLGVVCQNFIELFRNAPTYDGTEGSGAEIDIVKVATQLDVKRRRIYDIINIMESVEIVSRLKKNTYRWHGLDNLPSFFARIQKEGIEEKARKKNSPPKKEEPVDQSKAAKGMGKTCQKLIQIFLITGKIDIGLTDAAEEVLGPLPKSEKDKQRDGGGMKSSASVCSDKNDDGSDSKESGGEAKAMKTKIRRMYDIANVLQSIGIIRKENVGSTSSQHKPSFRWVFRILPRDMPKFLGLDHNVTPTRYDGSPDSKRAPITPEECHSALVARGTLPKAR